MQEGDWGQRDELNCTERTFCRSETNLSTCNWNSRACVPACAPAWPGRRTSRRAAAQARTGSTLRERSWRERGRQEREAV